MARCPNCSVENAETQRFCGDCGTPLPASSGRNAPDPAADETIPLPTDVLEPGTLFARRYQVIEELGAGGMGCVYRVLDKKIGEEIALKLIKPEVASDRLALERFSSELKLARQVVHRNVARMFDLNEEGHVPFITMEYVRGENLKRLIRKVGHLAPGQAIPFACQICAGLDEAHRRGIVHRDLKPQNVMIDEDGQAKILDFGLARLQTGAAPDRPLSRSGTPAYISPEQIRGLAVDARSDLYSLGVMLYEMLTGRTPYQADTVQELLDMHLREPPKDPRVVSPGISQELSKAVLRCLEKDPADRYQNAAELGAALVCLKEARKRPPFGRRAWAWIAQHKPAAAAIALGLAAAALFVGKVIVPILIAEPWKPSVAVLPVEDIGIVEAANRRFLAGLQQEITARLSGIPGLRVVPGDSVNNVGLAGKNTIQIGKELRARYLVKVSIAVEEGKVDGRLILIDAKRDEPGAPRSFSKDIGNFRALQDEIAVMIAKTLGFELTPENLRKYSLRGTTKLEAYYHFLEGMELLEAAEHEPEVRKALEALGRAVELDPAYALGHWGLGYAYERLYHSRQADKDPAALDKMYWHFKEASNIDPSFAETNLGVGWYYFNKGDNALAFDSFRKALELHRDGYMVNRDTGAFLRSIGLYEPALRYLERAHRLSPTDAEPLVQIAQCWNFLGRSEKALKYTREALAIREGDPQALFMHINLLGLTGRLDEAESWIRAMERFDLRKKRIPFLQEMVQALREGRGKPYAFGDNLPGLHPPGTYLYLALGMKEEALANIRKGIDDGFRLDGTYYYSYPSLARNPWYKALRGDPLFEEILKGQKELYDKELKHLEKL